MVPSPSHSSRTLVRPAAQSAAIASIDGQQSAPTANLVADAILETASFLEQGLGRSLLTQSLQVTLDYEDLVLPDGTVRTEIRLDGRHGPVVPLLAVSSVKATDVDGVETTLSATTDYWVFPARNCARIALRDSVDWPDSLREQCCITIALTAGYGTRETDVPPVIRLHLKELVTYFYRNPGSGFGPGDAGASSQQSPPHPVTILSRLERIGLGKFRTATV